MSRRERDRGAAAVEFALVLPILLLLVFGIIEFGRAYSVQTSITAAARNGARAMALQGSPSAAVAATQTAAQPYRLTSDQISVTPSTCPAQNTSNVIATVKVRYPLTLLSGFFGTSITLTGTGVMRCNG